MSDKKNAATNNAAAANAKKVGFCAYSFLCIDSCNRSKCGSLVVAIILRWRAYEIFHLLISLHCYAGQEGR